jgi:hypothetical protein
MKGIISEILFFCRKHLPFWVLRRFLFMIKQANNRKENWVMGRVACMGKDVLDILNIGNTLINVQKGRVDYLNRLIDNISTPARTNQIVSFICREDIVELIFQQEVRYGVLKKPPIALYMDSFSELTDQLFSKRNQNWNFCANYSDIYHTETFAKEFESLGLLSVDNLLEEYRLFFTHFRRLYGAVPIIFLHFPVKLDKREKFHLRYSKIKEAIDKLEDEFQPFYSFSVDENIVDWPKKGVSGLENFPYHYNKETYQNLAAQIIESGVFDQYKEC